MATLSINPVSSGAESGAMLSLAPGRRVDVELKGGLPLADARKIAVRILAQKKRKWGDLDLVASVSLAFLPKEVEQYIKTSSRDCKKSKGVLHGDHVCYHDNSIVSCGE